MADDAGVGPGRGLRPGMPRWVKVFVIIAIVVSLVVVIGLITGQLGPGGRHGPGRHLGARDDPDDATRTIEVTTLDAMRFEPPRINVSPGETVMFVVTNSGRAVHEFTLGDAAMQQEHAKAMAHIPAGMGHDAPNSITLQPGETKGLTWRFGDAATLEYACHVRGHYEAGMRGRITIT